jgi:hypothetical protein
MCPRGAIASRSSAVPSLRAVSAGTGAVKNTHAWAPTPDRDTSNAAGTDTGAVAQFNPATTTFGPL